MLLYSDGIIERQNAGEEFFTIKEVIKLVKKHKLKKAAEIIEILFEEADKFGNGVKWEDDATLMIIKRIKQK